MTVSALTTGPAELWASVVAKLVGLGYPFNPLTTSPTRYLATALRGIGGGSSTELNTGFPELLAATLVALSGTGSALDQSEPELLARILNAGGGGGGGALMLVAGGSLHLAMGGDLLLTGA